MRMLTAFLRVFKIQRIRNRILIAMIVVSLPALALLGYVSFNISKDMLMKTNNQTNQDHLMTSSEVADMLFKNINNLNQAMVMDEGIRNDLRSSTQVSTQKQAVFSQTIQSRIQKVINNNFLDSRYIESVCLYNLEFTAYCIGRPDDAGKYEGPNKQELMSQEKWYQLAQEAKGQVVFLGNSILENNRNSFSTVKLYRDAGTLEGKPIGILIVNLSSSMFDRVFVGAKSFGGTYYVIDASQRPARIIYPASTAAPALKQGDLAATITQLNEQGNLVSSYVNYTTEWTFLHAVKTDMLLKQSHQIGTFTAAIAFLIALIGVIVSFIIAEGITRPLLKLKKMMVEWTKGAKLMEQTFGTDEVGVIGTTFKRLAIENEELTRRLIDVTLKEREAELRALQAQINPHFLYNTLDSIYWMAKLHNHQNIAKMAISLSHSFKLSLNKGKEMILVSKELKHIEHYLTIQNIRYNHRFAFHLDIDESIMKVEMLKLVLQPLVENAISHGLEPKIGPGAIWLTGRRDGEFLIFEVKDDGVGIDDMSRTDQGFGLRNVKERLMLYYGPSSSFAITSERGKGTNVELRFRPYKKELDHDA